MKLLNLTNHPITIFDKNGEILTIAVSGMVARVNYDYKPAGFIMCGDVKIPMMKQVFRNIGDLPPQDSDTLCIVSWMVLEAAKVHLLRSDLVSPHSSNRAVIRDSYGDVIGVRALRT